jgi:CDGSH-type Zn-finger protein/quercetin dioxygenase-like cupin family protein
MSEQSGEAPLIACYKPYYCELKKGETYLWCACGRSQSQPFCDGSHKTTSFRPLRYVAQAEGEEVLFCGCKHSCNKPFCDGAHNNLKGTYDEDDPESEANRAIARVAAGPEGKARLDGGCFVCRIPALSLREKNGIRWSPVISSADGARYQSQFYFELPKGESPAIAFGDRHVVLLVTTAAGTVTINGRRFEVGSNEGVYVRPKETFRLRNQEAEEMKVFAAVCPQAEAPEWPAEMPGDFDQTHSRRVVGIDPSQRQRMADRFFQVLVDKRIGSEVVTQFIGEVPLSKAAPHRHLYEESIIVLKGEGFMWTESRKAPVQAGDVIFLPRKQVHSLQCTDPQGMLLAGVIYPGDNPSINY